MATQAQLQKGSTRVLSGERAYLNLGTRAVIPDMPGLRQFTPLTQAAPIELHRVSERPVSIRRQVNRICAAR